MTEVGSFFLFILQTFFVGKEGDILCTTTPCQDKTIGEYRQ